MKLIGKILISLFIPIACVFIPYFGGTIVAPHITGYAVNNIFFNWFIGALTTAVCVIGVALILWILIWLVELFIKWLNWIKK